MPKAVPNIEREPLLCKGIASLEAVKEPQNDSLYHTIQVKFEAEDGGQNGSAFLRFQPEFFSSSYDPTEHLPNDRIPSKGKRAKDPSCAKGFTQEEIAENDRRNSVTFVFATSIASDSGEALLQRLVRGPKGNMMESFDKACAELEEQGKLTPDAVRGVLAKIIEAQGRQYLYLLRNQQQTQDNGTRRFTDRMEVVGPSNRHCGVFPLDQDGKKEVERVVKSSTTWKRRKGPIAVTFETGQVQGSS